MSNSKVRAMFCPMDAELSDAVQVMAYVGSLGCRTTPETFVDDWARVKDLDMHLRVRFVVCAVRYSPQCSEIRKIYGFVYTPDFCSAVVNA